PVGWWTAATSPRARGNAKRTSAPAHASNRGRMGHSARRYDQMQQSKKGDLDVTWWESDSAKAQALEATSETLFGSVPRLWCDPASCGSRWRVEIAACGMDARPRVCQRLGPNRGKLQRCWRHTRLPRHPRALTLQRSAARHRHARRDPREGFLIAATSRCR